MRRLPQNFGLRIAECGLLAAVVACLCTSCAAPAKKYAAPDPAKVAATTKRLDDSVAKATATAARAKAHVDAAQKAADREAAASANVLQSINELAGLVPPELRLKFGELQARIDLQQAAAGDVVLHLSGAYEEHERLTNENAESQAARIALETAQAQYQAAAQKIAAQATAESQARHDAQKQLAREKIWTWVFRIGGGAIVLLIIVALITGKLSIAAIRAYFRF